MAIAVANQDTLFIVRSLRGDSARTRWLQRTVAKSGWPRRSVVGDAAAEAASLVVQHSPINAFQEQMLAVLHEEAKRGEEDASRVAMLDDRVRLRRGEPQRYGSSFSVKERRLVPDPIADVTMVDSLRKSVGLPPMAEYVKMLAKMYSLPVEWPPSAGRSAPP